MMYTTLNKLREHDPCRDGWKKLLRTLGKTKADDEPLAILTILESNGLEDAQWALHVVKGWDREIRLLVCAYACEVLPVVEREFPDDRRPRRAIETAALYAEGLADEGELAEASVDVRAAADDAFASYAVETAAAAAYAATFAATRAAFASYAAYAARENQEKQEELLRDLLAYGKGWLPMQTAGTVLVASYNAG